MSSGSSVGVMGRHPRGWANAHGRVWGITIPLDEYKQRTVPSGTSREVSGVPSDGQTRRQRPEPLDDSPKVIDEIGVPSPLTALPVGLELRV